MIDKPSGFSTLYMYSQNGLGFWLLKVIDSYIIHVCIICAKFDMDTPKHLFYSMLIKLFPNFNKCDIKLTLLSGLHDDVLPVTDRCKDGWTDNEQTKSFS